MGRTYLWLGIRTWALVVRLLALLACLLCWSVNVQAEPIKFYAPPGQVSATLQVMELGLANVTALFREATASFQYDQSSSSLSRLRLAINPANLVSVNTRNEESLAVLLGGSEIAFVTTDPVALKDGKGLLKGTLTLNGVNKSAQVDVTLNKLGESTGGTLFTSASRNAGLTLRTTIKRSEYNIKDETDPPRYGEDLTLTTDIQAIGH